MCQPFIARLKKNVVDSAKKMTLFVLYQQSAFVFAFFYSIYCIYEGNLDTSTYYLPLRLATPFNIEQSLFGWYLVWALQFMGGITYMFAIVVTLHFVCCCFYLEALCNHFDLLIESVDAEFCDNQGEPNDDFIWKNARKLFIDAIDHHNTIYEYLFYTCFLDFLRTFLLPLILPSFCHFRIFKMLADINSGTIFAFLTLSAPVWPTLVCVLIACRTNHPSDLRTFLCLNNKAIAIIFRTVYIKILCLHATEIRVPS